MRLQIFLVCFSANYGLLVSCTLDLDVGQQLSGTGNKSRFKVSAPATVQNPTRKVFMWENDGANLGLGKKSIGDWRTGLGPP